jgi:chemotaxis protein methyltransferase CheR
MSVSSKSLGNRPSVSSQLSDQLYQEIADLVYARSGLDLRKGKKELISSRLSKRVKDTADDSFQTYFNSVKADGTGASLLSLIDALTTNHTAFLRERSHFDFLSKQAPKLFANRDRVHIWCAASATGEEVYTILMVLLEALQLDFPSMRSGPSIKVLGTDISSTALSACATGVYSLQKLDPVPDSWKSKYFLKGTGRFEGMAQVKPQLRKMAAFSPFNLVEPQKHGEAFPVIFCRNVMIYFDKPTQEKVVSMLVDNLESEGHLMIGHAENLTGMDQTLSRLAPALYQKRVMTSSVHAKAAESRGRM